ncbi:MAG: MraY family glycosyltransferase [Planctomycetota bacterium]
MNFAWVGAPLAAAVIGVALWLHTRRFGFLPEDPPVGSRKRHRMALPTVGGLVGVLASGALLLGGASLAALGAFVCTAVGLADDRAKDRGSELPLPWKVVPLLGAAIIAAVAAAGATASHLSPTGWAVAVLLAFVVINAINFLDNTDGVAAAVGGTGLLLASRDGLPAAAALGWLFLGFLPFNWPRSRALLGDAGSLSLGFCLAVTTLDHGVAGGLRWSALLAPIAVPILDFVQVVVARLCLGFAPWIGDRRHLTHIAMNNGLPHVLVAPVFAGLTAGLYGLLA